MIYNKQLYDYSFNIVIDKKIYLVETKTCKNNLSNKNIKSIWVRTLSDLHTQYLDISHNPLIFLPDIFSLRVLNCSNCKIEQLPDYMPYLEELNCSNNNLTEIPDYTSLIKLECQNNNIRYVSHLKKIEHIICSDNPISDVPSNIQTIIAQNCPITTIHSGMLVSARSGTIRNGIFIWRSSKKIDTRYIILDWNTATCKYIFDSHLLVNLCKYLFNQEKLN